VFSGGSVISTRCSETYQPRTAQLSLFGIPLWYAANSPRVAIQVGLRLNKQIVANSMSTATMSR
jgi:hypothetical protein